MMVPTDNPRDEIMIRCGNPVNDIGPCSLDKNVLVFHTSNGYESKEPNVAPNKLAIGVVIVLLYFFYKRCDDNSADVNIRFLEQW